MMNASAIEKRLKTPLSVYCFESVDSTNNEARRRLEQGLKTDTLFVAAQQTAGRGRQGKSFYSPPNTGVYMTLVRFFDSPITDTVSVTGAAAVAVCRAIEALSDLRPQIKWVNDIYLGEKKVAGILCEAPGGFERHAVLIGIGVNITTQAFPPDVENGGGLGVALERSALVAAITDALYAPELAHYDGFIEEYRRRSLLIGREIVFIQNGVATPATAVGIDGRGGLIVQTMDGERRTLTGGEISIRRRQDG